MPCGKQRMSILVEGLIDETDLLVLYHWQSDFGKCEPSIFTEERRERIF